MTLSVDGALVFADLAGFTAFTAEQGDDAALALVERFEGLVRNVLPEGGRVVKLLGDGVFLYLPDPCSAVLAMLSLTRACEAHSTNDSPMWVRVGVHAGSALVRGDDLIGHDVNVAARITPLAAANEVLASQAVAQRVGDIDVRLERLAPAFVKGISEPLRLYRVLPGYRA